MNNSAFYQQVLGLQWLWKAEQVELVLAAKRVGVNVGVEMGAKWGDLVARGHGPSVSGQTP